MQNVQIMAKIHFNNFGQVILVDNIYVQIMAKIHFNNFGQVILVDNIYN
jgi:hypothetical protein